MTTKQNNKPLFPNEPEWMQKARTAPLHSDPESRKECSRLLPGQTRGNASLPND